MSNRRCFLLLAALPLLMLPMGCASQHDDTLEPTAARDGELPPDGRRIEVLLPAGHSGPEQIQAVVEHLEGQADVSGAKAMAHANGETDETELVVELWGQDMPPDEALAAELEAEFPFLAQGSVLVGPLDAGAEPPPGLGEAKVEAQDPEQLRQQIIDDLRDQGVEGEIDVTITDHPDGHREVEVDVHDADPPPA